MITGAGSGLGRGLALKFAEQGCRLVLCDIDATAMEVTALECRKYGASVSNFVVDLAKRDAVYAMADSVLKNVGNVDILINNAGIVTGQSFLDCPDALIEKTMQINTHAHFWTVKAFLPAMLERNHGHVVTVASAAGIFGTARLADYCASKFGAVGFNESLRAELVTRGCKGVNTTVVCPFFINTGMFEGVKPNILMSLLEPEYAVDKILEAILTNQHMLCMPRMLYVFCAIKGLVPLSVYDRFAEMFGLHTSMEEFKGRNKNE